MMAENEFAPITPGEMLKEEFATRNPISRQREMRPG